MHYVRDLLIRFAIEDTGQDLIEYGLLSAGIATVGILAWDAVRTGLGVKYAGLGFRSSGPLGTRRSHTVSSASTSRASS